MGRRVNWCWYLKTSFIVNPENVTLTNNSILWRNLIFPGHEVCRLLSRDGNPVLQGITVFSHDRQACELNYEILVDSRWQTEKGNVFGWIGAARVELKIEVGTDNRWLLNDVEYPGVKGCVDIDLNFSPSTNLLPIRRLNLSVGQQAIVQAAWLRFPGFQLEPLSQTYLRVGEFTYHYESSTGFVAQLTVNDAGFVTNYPGIWEIE